MRYSLFAYVARVGARLALGGLLAAGCGADPAPSSDATADAAPADPLALPASWAPDAAGPWAAGHTTIVLAGGPDGRDLPLSLWWPTPSSAAAPEAVSAMETGPHAATLATLLPSAPTACVASGTDARAGGPLARSKMPLLLLSHCHGCVRWWMHSTAAALAQHGFAVAAVDHVGNTLWEQLQGKAAPLSPATLARREADLRFVLARIEASDPALPAGFAAAVDVQALGALGHSFGAVTVGRLATVEPRVKAVAALGAPMENPLLPGVVVHDLAPPLLMALLEEDNSIGAYGNTLLEENFATAPGPAWLLRVADAGHFSVTDIAGLSKHSLAGCGEAKRMTTLQPFAYPDPAAVRAKLRPWLVAFFVAHVVGDARAKAWLAAPPAQPGIAVQAR